MYIYAFYQPGKIGDGFFLGLQQFLCFLETKLASLPICAVCHVTSCRPVMAG